MDSNKKRNLFIVLIAILFTLTIFVYIKYLNPAGFDPEKKPNPEIVEKFKAFSGEVVESNIINFAGDMNRESVENNLKLFPSVQADYIWEDDRTLAIEIIEKPDKDIDFYVNITEEALTKEGAAIDKKVVQKFKVDGTAQIDFITPEGEILDLTKNITVRFSRPMISLTTFDNQPECPITITPELPGKCVWITTSTFQFRPEEGFPIGAKYNVSIPEGIETLSGDKTTNSKSIEITTPKFQILNKPTSGVKDQPIIITFNAPVSLDNFKENFEIDGLPISDLNIEYFKVDSTIEGEQIEKNNIVTIMPKSNDWGYGKNYTYKLNKGLKSIRGNVPLSNTNISAFYIQELLTDYSSFIYKDDTIKNKELYSNIQGSYNSNIINLNKPKVLLSFYEEVDLNKEFFFASNKNGVTVDFNLKYAKKIENVGVEQLVTDDKKKIIIEFNANNVKDINLKIFTSKMSSSEDEVLQFTTKNYNEVIDYEFINYKKSCIVLKNEILRNYSDNNDMFDFNGKDGNINYISLVGNYTRDDDCKYEAGKYTYILNTQLNPSTDYSLTIKKGLLDRDNYTLLRDYNETFKTDVALNEDKRVSVIDNREFILVPTNITPLGVAINSVNLDKVSVKICEGDFEITDLDYIKNEECEIRVVSINDLGFTTNFSVLNLEEIFGKTFTKSLVSLNIEKVKEDKTEYELEREDNINNSRVINYIRTDKSVVLKSNKNTSLRLSDFKTGDLLNNEISSIDNYENKSKYSAFGKYLGKIKEFRNNVQFEPKGDGLYKLSGNVGGYLLITLKSGEQILFNSNYSNYSSVGVKSYLATDRAIYKPGNTVNIKGILRDETATGYQLTSIGYNLRINDSNYKQLVDEKMITSDDGTFEYELILDEDASLGNYSIRFGNDSISFAVEEYEKPDFKVEVGVKKENYLYSETPELEILGEYYIGNALANANGSYNINATSYNFHGGITTGYNWGENTNFWRYWEGNNSDENVNVAYNQEFVLDSEGKTNIEVDISNTTNDMVYNLSTTLTDPNTKKSIASSASFKVLNSDVFVGLKQDKYYYEFGDTVNLDFVSVDIEGNKVGNKSLDFKVYKVDYIYDKETLKTNKKETLLTEKSLVTGSTGETTSSYKINDYGEFRFEIELDNKKYKTTKTLYVSGFNLLRPTEQEHDLGLIKDKEKYDIGDTAEVIIQSPVTGVKALVTVEKLDEILFEEVIDITSTSQKYSLPIKKEYLPNLELKVFLIKTSNNSPEILEELKIVRLDMIELEKKLYGEQEDIIVPLYISYDIMYKGGFIPYYIEPKIINKTLLQNLAELKASEQKLMQEIIPNYLIGSIPIKINLDSVKLNAEAKTDKNEYLPSDSTTIELTIVDNEGNPVNGEAVISVVDEALLALKNNDNDIVDFFYSTKSNNVRTTFNLQNLIKRFEFNELEQQFEEEQYKTDSNKSIRLSTNSVSEDIMGAESMDMESDSGISAGMTMPASAQSSGNAVKLRTDFKDSAYYNGVVKVVNGKAKVTIPKLPDNLTTWVVKGFTVTKDTKVGNFESKFQVKKTLNILPSIPRFFVSGDEMEISAVVINNSEKALKIESSIDITNVEVLEEPKISSIPANGQELIVWKVKVDGMKNDIDWKQYFSDITIMVKSGDLQDSLKVSKKIIPYSTPEYTFTNGSTYGLSYEEKINLPDYVDKTQGQLDISYGATILTSLLDNVENIASMPFDNFYTTVSALKKGAILKGLYQEAGRLEEFKEIEVTDYNGVTHKLDDIINLRIKYLKNYQNYDGGMMTYDDCVPRGYGRTCSNFGLTGEFLNMAKLLEKNGYEYDKAISEKALKYYENELDEKIEESEEKRGVYRSVEPFYQILGYDSEYIKKYLLTNRFVDSKDYTFDNISKLKIILLLQEVDEDNELIDKYLKELKNKTIIEARGTLVPANSYNGNNIISTALALRVFINSEETEKLIVENFARWLLAQKRENGEFGSSYDSTEVMKSITEYINFTQELDNVDFEAIGYLNYNEITSEIFNDENKFSLKQESYNLQDYINFGVDNSLGFEKKGDGKLYYDVGLRYFLPIEKIEARDEGIIVTRNYYDYTQYNESFKEECINPYWYGYSYKSYNSYSYCNKVKIKNIDPVSEGNKGDMLVGEIEIIVPSERNNVIINNFIPAGAEIINTNLDTTSAEVQSISGSSNNGWYSGFSHTEIKDDRVLLFADHLYEGSYKYTYVIKLNHKGTYHNRPAVAEELKKPEIWGRSKGEFFEIK